MTFDVLAKLVSVTFANSISNFELPHFEWILLPFHFIANAHELLLMLSFNFYAKQKQPGAAKKGRGQAK